MGTIVNERIVDYINSLDKGNSPVCNAIRSEERRVGKECRL